MKSLIPIIVSLFFICPMRGQVNWFPTGAKWYYDYSSFGFGGGITILEVLPEDTLFGNTPFQRLLERTIIVDQDALDTIERFLFVREVNQVVYGYSEWLGYTLLYDFNASVGDTLDVYFGGLSPGPFVVDSVGVEDINGFSLKFQILMFPDIFEPVEYGYLKVVEGLGSTDNFLFLDHIIIQPFDFPFYYFRCYEDENIGLVKSIPSQIECDFIPGVTATKPNIKQTTSLFPNPADDFIFFHSDGLHHFDLQIVDMTGRIRQTKASMAEDHYKIDISELENGVYFFLEKDEAGQIIYTGKFSRVRR